MWPPFERLHGVPAMHSIARGRSLLGKSSQLLRQEKVFPILNHVGPWCKQIGNRDAMSRNRTLCSACRQVLVRGGVCNPISVSSGSRINLPRRLRSPADCFVNEADTSRRTEARGAVNSKPLLVRNAQSGPSSPLLRRGEPSRLRLYAGGPMGGLGRPMGHRPDATGASAGPQQELSK